MGICADSKYLLRERVGASTGWYWCLLKREMIHTERHTRVPSAPSLSRSLAPSLFLSASRSLGLFSPSRSLSLVLLSRSPYLARYLSRARLLLKAPAGWYFLLIIRSAATIVFVGKIRRFTLLASAGWYFLLIIRRSSSSHDAAEFNLLRWC